MATATGRPRRPALGVTVDTAAGLEAEFQSAEVADWQRVRADDNIRHSTLGIVGVDEIHQQNRPTQQQVAATAARLDPHEPGAVRDSRISGTVGGGTATTGGGLALLAVIAPPARRPPAHGVADRRRRVDGGVAVGGPILVAVDRYLSTPNATVASPWLMNMR